MPKSKDKSLNDSFEKLFTELEETVTKLEGGDLSLEESLALYQRGTELAKKCAAILDHAELQVKELAPSTQDVDIEDKDEEE